MYLSKEFKIRDVIVWIDVLNIGIGENSGHDMDSRFNHSVNGKVRNSIGLSTTGEMYNDFRSSNDMYEPIPYAYWNRWRECWESVIRDAVKNNLKPS